MIVLSRLLSCYYGDQDPVGPFANGRYLYGGSLSVIARELEHGFRELSTPIMGTINFEDILTNMLFHPHPLPQK